MDNGYQYSDIAMFAIAEHELGHALGLVDHSNNLQDIMYPSNEQIGNTNPLLQGKYDSLLLIAFYTTIAVIVFISVSWLLNMKKDKHLRMSILSKNLSTVYRFSVKP